MKLVATAAAIAAAMMASASAGPMWESHGFTVKPQDAAKVVAATDKWMATADGTSFPGRLLLLGTIANGADPTTHSYILLFKSAADAEKWGMGLEGSKAWMAFLDTVTPIMSPTGEARYAIAKSWGTASDANLVWEGHLLKVKDPVAAVAAIDWWFGSATGKKFPGEAHLSGVVAAGATEITHVVSVGFKSEADMETWNDMAAASADWPKFLEKIEAASDYEGANLTRQVKAWGTSTMTN